MPDKVRHIELRPDEFIAGTFGQLSMEQFAVYWAVCLLIYSRGGPVPNDASYIGSFAKGQRDTRAEKIAITQRTRRAINALVKLEKLRLSVDGQWLTNKRATSEIDRATRRVESARQNGSQGGRKANPNTVPTPYQHRTNIKPRLNNIKDLAKPAGYKLLNTYESSLSESLTDAARDPALAGGCGPRASSAWGVKSQEVLLRLAAAHRQKLLQGRQ